jgi:16S rRNA G966 N2-methylase RsmD
VLEALGNAAVSEKTLVIAEHEKKNDLAEKYGELQRIRKLQQGDAALSFYRRT